MKKILIVDDEFVFHMLYVKNLEENVPPVLARGDCQRLITVVDKHNPDLVLIDIRVANYRGLDIMKEISKAFHNLPFRLCTSSIRDEIKSFCESGGISATWTEDKKGKKITRWESCHIY